MSTLTPAQRPPSSPNVRSAAPPPGGGALALATLDPVRLLKRYYPWLVVAAIIGGAIGTVAHFLLARYYPTYTATATFECRPAVVDPRQSEGFVGGQDDLSRFMATQAAVMVSSTVLDEAVKNPDLERSAWARQFVRNGAFQPRDAQAELAKQLSARPVPQTSLVRLSMSWRDPDAVRSVIDAVADAYRESYRQSTTFGAVRRKEALNRQIAEIERAMKDRNVDRERKLAEMRVTDLREGSSIEDARAMRLNESLVTTMKELSTTRSLLTRYESILVDVVPILPDDVLDESKRDPVVTGLDNQLANLRTDEASLLKQGFGSEHPTVISIRNRIEATQQEREVLYHSISRKLFDAQIERLRTSEQALQSQMQEVGADLEETSKRKEDLTRLRVFLDQLQEDVQRLAEERSELVRARNDLDVLSNNDVFQRIQLIQPAQRPNEMAFPKLGILVPLGVVMLTGLVGGVLVLREVLDQRVKGPADVAIIPRMRVLGMIPDASEDPVKAANLETAFRDAPTGAVSESIRQLRAPLTKAMDQAGYRSVLIQAGMPSSGATTVVINLALACAGAGERVLIIDANLRRPGVHRAFGAPETPGLGDCLAEQVSLSDAIIATKTRGLSILPAGSAANRLLPERLSSELMTRIIAEASANFERVIIDAPPMIVAGDGLAIANRCDATVLVVRALNEKRGLVNRLRGQLAETRAEFLGVVVNAVRSSAGGYFKGNIRATHEYQTQTK